MSRLLVSVDVGGTLAHVDGLSLSGILIKASPLPLDDARQVVRQQLYTQPEMTPAIVQGVCAALRIHVDAFPQLVKPAPLRLVPAALPTVRAISKWARIVTLSNVSCLEAETEQLRGLLHPWVSDHFPSCRIGYAKPDPAAYHHVASACQSSAENMIHIGDDWTCDVIGARSAGTTAIWISNGRMVPQLDRLDDPGILVATDLLDASRYVADLSYGRIL